MTSPKFHPWKTLLDGHPDYNATTPNSEYIQQTQEVLTDLVDKQKRVGLLSIADFGWIEAECRWHTLGRPYYKVYPTMAHQLAHTRMQFTPDHLLSAYPVFSLLLPPQLFPTTGILIRLITKEDDLTGCLCTHQEIMEKRNADKVLSATFIHDQTCAIPGASDHIILSLPRDQPVEDRLKETVKDTMPTLPGAIKSDIPLEIRGQLWKLALATMMFSTHHSTLVTHDVPQDQLQKRFPPSKKKAKQRLTEERKQEFLSTIKGWRVGSEMTLPRTHYSSTSSGTGSALSASHIRSGHMKMQPHGPNNSQRKLIYVAPTVVRPDLPMSTSHGYRIK